MFLDVFSFPKPALFRFHVSFWGSCCSKLFPTAMAISRNPCWLSTFPSEFYVRLLDSESITITSLITRKDRSFWSSNHQHYHQPRINQAISLPTINFQVLCYFQGGQLSQPKSFFSRIFPSQRPQVTAGVPLRGGAESGMTRTTPWKGCPTIGRVDEVGDYVFGETIKIYPKICGKWWKMMESTVHEDDRENGGFFVTPTWKWGKM